MKRLHIRPITFIAALLLLFGFDAQVLGYPTQYGPFQPGREPAAVQLNKSELVSEVKSTADNNAGAVRTYRLPVAGQGQQQITLALRGATNGWEISLRDAQSRSLMHASSTNSMTSSQMEVYSWDLNSDSQPDFIVNVWSGGCGLAADGSEVTFLLSGKDGYRATSFYLYAFGNQDLVRFKPQGTVYFISNDLIGSGGEKTRDGREHNFWVYNLNRIDGNRLFPADADQPRFPKWVWLTNKPNHDETTQLTQEQKIRLLMKRNSSK